MSALAIFDLLKEGKTFSAKEQRDVAWVAEELLAELKERALNIERWRESRQVKAEVRTTIYDRLVYLPPELYTDTEVQDRTGAVYQFVYGRY